MSTHPDVTITADPALPTIEIVREFDATRDRVFRAHVDPDLVAQWVGPHDVVTEIDYWDARTGGSWRYVARRGEEAYGFRGCFHEVRKPSGSCRRSPSRACPDSVSLEFLDLVPLPDGRCRLRGLSVVDSIEARDALVASGMESGVVAGYQKLDALLAR